MEQIKKLQKMASYASDRQTIGLKEHVVEKALRTDPRLAEAVDTAFERHTQLTKEFPEILRMNEHAQIAALQENFLNFYAADAVNPYVALSGNGPWVVTSCGAVIFDCGGYGMLGFGHAPDSILEVLGETQCMANIMTASFAQKRFADRINREIGHRRTNQKKPVFDKYICLNSGSEAVTLAARLSDINAKNMTDPGGRYAGKRIKFLALKGAFHGRTDRPSQVSDSSLPHYKNALASFRDRDNLLTVAPNDVIGLEAVFSAAERDGIFIEAMFVEPVMGEGDPGKAISPDFYAKARALTEAHGALLIVDSIQAGLRTHGCLSIVDYPGFTSLPAPDIETYSKALNAGQYPFSVLALSKRVVPLYKVGVYGNTMTTNPRALGVAALVLDRLTPKIRANIQERGREFVERFKDLQKELPTLIEEVQGTGLLFSVKINEKRMKVLGETGLEILLRRRGIGVIHGGTNSLRFTPVFDVTSEHINLVIDIVGDALRSSDRKTEVHLERRLNV